MIIWDLNNGISFSVSVIKVWRPVDSYFGLRNSCFLSYIVSCILSDAGTKSLFIRAVTNFGCRRGYFIQKLGDSSCYSDAECWLYIKVPGDIPQNMRGKSLAPWPLMTALIYYLSPQTCTLLTVQLLFVMLRRLMSDFLTMFFSWKESALLLFQNAPTSQECFSHFAWKNLALGILLRSSFL